MPVHDLSCPSCGAERPGTYCPLVTLAEPDYSRGYKVTQAVLFPPCACGSVMVYWVPRVAVDAYEPGHEFTTDVRGPDGSYHPVLVDSLSKLRQIERDSERAQKNGEGQQLVWRDYSQDPSNREVHTIAANPTVKPDPAFVKRLREGGGAGATRETDRAYGPGVTDANTSALGGL